MTSADPRFRTVDAGIPWCATTVVGHSAGPWGGYFEVGLDCHSIAVVELFQSSFGEAIGCEGCDWNAIGANVQSTAHVIMDKCKESNAQNPWTVLDAVTKLAPFVSGAAAVLGGVGGQLDEASNEGGFLYALQLARLCRFCA